MQFLLIIIASAALIAVIASWILCLCSELDPGESGSQLRSTTSWQESVDQCLRPRPPAGWCGTEERLRQELLEIGYLVPADVIAGWSNDEFDVAWTWVASERARLLETYYPPYRYEPLLPRLRRSLSRRSLPDNAPPCLARLYDGPKERGR